MNTVLNSRLLAVGSEDTMLLSLVVAALLYFLLQSLIGIPEYEQARLRELYSVPQQHLFPAGVPCNLQRRSRNICDTLMSPANVRAVVFWASQSGTAEALASRYASELSTAFPLGAMTANLADYDHKHMPDVPSQALLVFILSTFGDGDPPDNGTALLESLHQLRKQSANLNNVRYLIFGLGNSNYTHFNKYALDIDGMLKGMGATRLGRVGLGNDREGATEEDFVAWKNESIQQVARTLHLRPVEREYSPRIQIRPWRGGNCDTRHGVSPTVYYGEPQYAPPTADRSTTVVLPVIQAKQLMLSKEAIGESESSRECVHLEFSLEDHPSITYETGDYLCIWPVNPEQEVSALLKVLGVWNTRKNVIDIVPADDTSSSNIRIPTPTTMESLFRYFLDICGPVSRELVRGIAELTSDGDFKRRLEALTRDRDAFYEEVTLKKLTLAAVLQAATTVRDENGSAINVAVSYVLENLKKLQPRSYSISSSAAVDPRIAAITALAVSGPPRPPRETSSCPSHRFRGLASNYLLQLQKEYNRSYSRSQQPTNYYYSTAGPRGLLEGGKVFAYIRRSNFKLPPDPSTPIIMIGSGTGVSPFRAFVQERMKLKNQGCEVGKTVLLVGHRAPDQDYYYQDLWQEASKALGKRFEVYTAFSRVDTQPRQYVQDLLATKSDLVLDILAANQPKGGVMYICGSSLMANGVKKSLVEICSQGHLQSVAETAEKWVGELSRLRRLQEDSWG